MDGADGQQRLPHKYFPDCWPVSAEAATATSQATSLYPNPADEVVYVSGNEHFIVEFTDQAGRKVMVDHIGSSERKVDIAGLPAGFYVIRLIASGTPITTHKLIKR